MKLENRTWLVDGTYNSPEVSLGDIIFESQGSRADCKFYQLLNEIQFFHKARKGENISFDINKILDRIESEANYDRWIVSYSQDLKFISPFYSKENVEINFGGRKRLRRRRGYKRQRLVKDIKRILRSGRPVGFSCISGKWGYKGNMLYYDENSKHKGHAMTIYGYDKNFFYIQNPWGEKYKHKITPEDLLIIGGGFSYYYE